MKLSDICVGVYAFCPKIKSQKAFVDSLFESTGGGSVYIADTYKKQLFSGAKPFTINQKKPLRTDHSAEGLKQFFMLNIADEKVPEVFAALGIPEKKEPDKEALCIALAFQMKAIIDSSEEDANDILEIAYREAKETNKVSVLPENCKPLYPGDGVSASFINRYEIDIYDKVNHVWVLTNTGKIKWSGRKLVYVRGPKDRPEANPSAIQIPDVSPGESIKITTTFDSRGFVEVTHCKWEMQDCDGENCFPGSELRFCVTIDARFEWQ